MISFFGRTNTAKSSNARPRSGLRIAVDVNVFMDGKGSGIPTYLEFLLNQLQVIDKKNEYFLFETRQSKYRVTNPLWNKLLFPTILPGTLWIQLVFPILLLRHKIDVLWSPKFLCPLFYLRSIRVFTTIHDLTMFRFSQTMASKDRLLMRYLVPLSINRSNAIFTDSFFIKRDIENHFRNLRKLVIAVPLGKPDWKIPEKYSAHQRGDFLFFAGNLEPRKNLLNVFKALEILFDTGTAPEIHVAFPGSWKAGEALEYVNNSKIKASVKMLGFLSVSDLQHNYLSCKALVYPSVYEGFGLPVLEALSLDCLVLTSAGTVMQEVAEDSALYFNPFDPRDIAEKIRSIYSDNFDRTPYLRNRDKILSKYSWKTAAERILSSFEET